ncbi:MAG TPA: hypothetical protein ENK85_00590 [Saprospiraceae bacterium]|nr:hypothetical protein [Saprospiraceae bacterium]
MQFLAPGMLLALLAIAIPIIIHLFYFRRFKKVPFSNVRFLKEIKEETSTRSKLRNLLVLLSRILAIACLVLAFAQPYIPFGKKKNQGPKDVSVFVDNSFSMSALDKDVPLLEKAKQKAKEIVKAYDASTQFQILTHDFEGRHQRLVSKEEALGLVDEIEQTPEVRSLSKVLKRQRAALSVRSQTSHLSYLISDFQKSIMDLTVSQDTILKVNLVPLHAVQEANIGIDSCWLAAPVPILNQPNTLLVKIQNYGQQAAEEVKLALSYQGQVRPQGTISVPAGSAVIDTVHFVLNQPGWQEMVVSINDYPVQFDDKYYVSFPVMDKLNILTIHDGKNNKYLKAALEGVSYFRYQDQSVQSLDYSAFPKYQLIILHELKNISSGLASSLKEFIIDGGNVLVFPGATGNISSLNNFLTSLGMAELSGFEKVEKQVQRVNTQAFVFKDVFQKVPKNIRLPKTSGSFSRKGITHTGEEILLTNRDGTPYLVKMKKGEGNLYVLSAPLDLEYNDLVKNSEIFVPMLFKMAVSTGKALKISYVIGRDEMVEVRSTEVSPDKVLKFQYDGQEFLPEQRVIGDKVILGINNQIKKAGFYRLTKEGTDTLGVFGYNYDHRESNLSFFTDEQLAQKVPGYTILAPTEVADLSATIKHLDNGKVLWRWGLIGALLFLALEILLIRFWKV